MFDEIKQDLHRILTSRQTVLLVVFIALGTILLSRCFLLQIVEGEEYLNSFLLQIEKIRDIPATRGRILDCNGKVLAYNELSYSVKIEDVFESNQEKNKKLNATIYRLIQMIEQNGDHVITDFKVRLNEDEEFVFTDEGTAHLRFLADVFGYLTIDKLSEEERQISAEELVAFLSNNKGFAIGEYAVEGDSKSGFVPGKGLSKSDWLKVLTIRYAMRLTSFRKYIGTVVATNVSEKTVAVLMENEENLPGVSIIEDTVRRYEDSKYFAHVLGYTGKISSDQLTQLNEEVLASEGVADAYSINDVVGKSGIESYMETTLQGKKGSEKVVVNTTGKVLTIVERQEASAGNDVQLTIDKDLTIAIYNIVEQKLAGMLYNKIDDIQEFNLGENGNSSDIRIPIYDVYYAVINNNLVDIRHFSQEDALQTEAEVYASYLSYRQQVYDQLREELTENLTAYQNLPKEYQVYQSNIVTLLGRNGILITSAINQEDATQIAWAKEEVISLGEYLQYCIAQNWIDVSKLDMDSKYSDSSEVYEKLSEKIFELIDKNIEFQKRFYKYMLLNHVITGKQICMLLCEQNIIQISDEEREAFYNDRISAYAFMKKRIQSLDITPAQLALDPCNASVVVTDINTGQVRAIVSYPGYDNNKMANSIDAEYYAQLNADKSNPLYNYATQSKTAPGSTFKPVSAAAGLMEDVISVESAVSCTGTFTAITPSPRCWRVYGHGAENVITALRDSCNYYFYNVGYRLSTRTGTYDEQAGLDTLRTYADWFGLTEKTGIEIAEEMPEVSTEDPVRSAIGQGNNSFTTVGLARYTSALANKGTCFQLTLLDRVLDSGGNELERFEPTVRNVVEMPQAYWNAIQQGMRKVVENKSYYSDLAVNVAGKTGTAEQTRQRPNHSLFISYAPYENPEIAVTTRIIFGYSSDYAAQITKEVYKYYYGLVQEEEIITGTADIPDIGISNEM